MWLRPLLLYSAAALLVAGWVTDARSDPEQSQQTLDTVIEP